MNPTLFLLMRTDMASMNPGKMCAQAAHAANAFEHSFTQKMQEFSANPPVNNENSFLNSSFTEWKQSTAQGFGVTIVLGADGATMETKIKTCKELGYVAGVVHDPTYPIKDGDTLHLIPVDTCAFVFSPDRDFDPVLKSVLGDLNLCP